MQSVITAAASLGGASRLFAMNRPRGEGGTGSPLTNGSDRLKGTTPVPVITPDAKDLPFTLDNGVKLFHLIAEPVRRKIAPWKAIDCWSFNGSCPGPTIQVNQGDRVRIVVENHLPESTAIHWHGLEIPYAMDGMPYLSQKPIAPGSRLAYEFTVHQNGTFFYHSHSPMQQMMGMIGLFILHPSRAHAPIVDHDFGVVLQEWLCCRTTPFPTPPIWSGTGSRSTAPRVL
jgi:FtsP/CotA-like multicopper oxidase with cupredoxin domain